MIHLKIESYCHDCGDFKACTSVTNLYSCGQVAHRETTITCKNKDRCDQLYKHIKENLENEER